MESQNDVSVILAELRASPEARDQARKFMGRYHGSTPGRAWLVWRYGRMTAASYFGLLADWIDLNNLLWSLQTEQKALFDLEAQARLFGGEER